jgi:hypothetical protein
MAPLTDDIPAPVSAIPTFDLPDPAAQPAPTATFRDLLAPSAPPQPDIAPSPFAPPIVPPPAAAPMPPPVAAAPSFAQPVAAAQPAPPPAEQQAAVAPPSFAPAPPVQAPTAPPPAPTPVAQPAPVPPVPPAQAAPAAPATSQAGGFSFAGEPLAPSSFAGEAGPTAFTLERHHSGARSGNGPLDWIAFVLAFLAPPIGLLLGIGAVIVDSRSKGYAAGIAKAAIGIGAVLTLVLGVAVVVVTKINNDQAAHAAIVASSRAWCTKLESTPTTLSSDTLGWPSPGATIPASITAMTSYETYWDALAKLAPAGIRTDTQKVANTAKSIVTGVQSTQTLNDANNVAQMQNVVAASGIHSWVSTYCN